MNTPPPKQSVTGWQRTLVIRIDKFIYQFSKHWLAAFNILVGIYIGLPVLAPTLMHVGATVPARIIYTIYSPMCHQMASRSFFLFGEQPAYPRQLAGTSLRPIESYMAGLPEFAGVDPHNWIKFTYAARAFIGNSQMGIYGFVLIAGLVYGLLRRRYHIKPLPFLVFIIVGMGPIGLDGFSQLFGYWSTPLNGAAPTGFMATVQSIFPLRESTPLLRTLTGALFGFMLAWLTYPHVNEGMKGTERDLERKLRQIGEL
jgi:uncharacterized membrane protein